MQDELDRMDTDWQRFRVEWVARKKLFRECVLIVARNVGYKCPIPQIVGYIDGFNVPDGLTRSGR